MHDNTLLFMRVGLNPTALKILSALIDGKEPSIRACQLWFNGDRIPKNGIVELAHRLDEIMDNYSLQILHEFIEQKEKQIWVTKFNDDDDLWSNHSDMFGLNNSVHSALINRIIIVGNTIGVKVFTQPNSCEDSDYDHTVSWNSCANILIETRSLLNNN